VRINLQQYCPIEGFKVFNKPEWIDQNVSDTLVANYWIIGESIIYSRPEGFSNFEGIRKVMALNEEVAAFVSGGSNPYIQIEDYSFLKGSSSKARKYFIQTANKNNRRKSIIFCNTTLPFNIAIKIGKKFITTNKYVHVAKNYKGAITHAKTLSDYVQKPIDPVISNILENFNHAGNSLLPVELLSKKHWQIETPEFSNHVVVINKNILHSTSTGFLRSKHISLIDDMRLKCLSSLPDNSTLDYIIVNGGELKGSSRSARFKFMQSLREWYNKFPFKMYITYNANIFTRTAFQIARPVMPFKIKAAKDLAQALEFVHHDQKKSLPIELKVKEKKISSINQKDIENLLALIGNMNWEVEGFKNSFKISEDHPFFYIHQSIKLIKEELDDLFADRTRLEGQLQQSQKMESIGTLTGGIAHDFNNIMGIILGNTELALEDVPESSPAYSKLKEIKTASLRAANIVKQLLSFSRKTGNKLKPIHITPVIKDALKFLRSTIPTFIKIDQDFSTTDEIILADPTQINQIVMNLCINASHAMEQTGGNLKVIVEKMILDDHSAKTYSNLEGGNYVKVIVSDTGPGISPKIIDQIFDPYFTTKEIGKGSGMGLAVVHGIVKNHGGAISVESSPGKGTKFSMLFPLVQQEPVVETPKIQEIPRGSETILFVDDEVSIVKMAQRMFGRLGYKVETATTPQDALEKFGLNPDHFDLIITDMTMPRMTGMKLSEALMAIRPDIPIIICTGHSTLVDKEKAKELGLAAFLMKPIDISKTAQTIRKVLDKN
jgi:signal transduction histidine kinase/ActR/RegA family two-component response regulator